MTPPGSRRTIILLILIVAGLCLPASAQDLRFPVATETLPNGLRILVIEDHAVPAVTVFTLFRVGSRNERPCRTGMSHLF